MSCKRKEIFIYITPVVLTILYDCGSMLLDPYYRGNTGNMKGADNMDAKLFDSELRVMKVLWREGDTTAKHISDVLKEEVGWNINTTYALIKRCIAKGAIERREPNFVCHPLISRETVQEAETNELIGKLYDGAPSKLFAALLGKKALTAEQIEKLKTIVEEWE